MRKIKSFFLLGILLSSLSAWSQSTLDKEPESDSENKMFFTTTEHPNYHKPAGGICGEVLCNGQFAILMDNGTVPYTIDLSNGESYVTTYNYFLFDSLCVGTYTYTVTDDLGSISSNSVTITQTAGVTAIMDTVIHVPCPGGFTGLAGIEVLTGEAPFTHALNAGPAQAQPYFEGLPAGPYDITVTDANGCSTNVGFSISQPTPWGVSFSNSNSCNNDCSGSIDVSVTGVTPPYTYSKDNGLTYQVGNTFNNLCQGNHNIVIKDSNGCLANSVEVIGGPSSFDISPTFTEPSCHGAADGTIDFNVSGGTPGFIYSIDNGPFVPTDPFPNVGAGFHELLVVDANGCELTDTITVTEPVALNWLFIANNPSNCGVNDGSFEVAAMPGCPPFIYTIDGGITFQPSGFFSNLYSGLYNLIVIDCNGCADSVKVPLSDNVMTSNTDYATDPLCNSSCDGTLGVSQNFGTAPFTYTLNTNPIPQATGDYSGICAGQHFVTIEDANLCLAIQEVNLNEVAPITFDTTITSVSCPGLTDGSITFTNVQGGDGGPYQYSIDNGATFQSSGTFTNLPSGTYGGVVSDGTGCQTSASMTVLSPAPLFAFFNAADVSCNGDTDGFVQLIAVGGVAPYVYSLDGNTTSNGIYPNLAPNVYSGTITDAYGCTSNISAPVNEPPILTLGVNSSSDPICSGAGNGTIELVANGGTPLYLYSIFGGAILSTTGNFNFSTDGTYSVYVEDVNGCIATNTVSLTDPASTSIDVTSVTHSSCKGLCEGEVEFSMTNGASLFTINQSSGNIAWVTNDDFIIDSICGGTLMIHVADDFGCLDSTEVLILNQADMLVDTSNFVNVSCFGVCDGMVTVDLSNGTLPYSVTSSSGTVNAVSSTQFNISGICGGAIQIQSSDSSGCSNQTEIFYSNPDSLYFTYNQLVIGSCTGCNDAEAEVTIFGGTGPYATDWTSFGSANTTSSANDLTGGAGIVCVTDSNGCEFCDSVIVDFIDDVGLDDWSNNISIYPNPSNKMVLISSPLVMEQILLYDNRGRLIEEKLVNELSITLEVSALPKGIYTIRIYTTEGITNQKLIVQ